MYLHLTDEEEVKATNRDEEASREVGVPLQWSIATEISNGTTFVVRRALMIYLLASNASSGMPCQATSGTNFLGAQDA